MSDAPLSHGAAMLLRQLRAVPSADAFDREAAEELVAQGLAMHIPATGSIAATEAGRTDGLSAAPPARPAPIAADIVSGLESRSGHAQTDGAEIPAMGEGIGVNGTAGSEGVSKGLKSSFEAPHH